jgi:Lar family restriction alleviation protein
MDDPETIVDRLTNATQYARTYPAAATTLLPLMEEATRLLARAKFEPEPLMPLPCPFCGGSASSMKIDNTEIFTFNCRSCGANGPTLRGRDAACNAWNTRVDEDDTRDPMED